MITVDMDLTQYLNTERLYSHWQWFCFSKSLGDITPPTPEQCIDWLLANVDHARLQQQLNEWLITDQSSWCFAEEIYQFFDEWS